MFPVITSPVWGCMCLISTSTVLAQYESTVHSLSSCRYCRCRSVCGGGHSGGFGAGLEEKKDVLVAEVDGGRGEVRGMDDLCGNGAVRVMSVRGCD
jgi:hypothetical protein